MLYGRFSVISFTQMGSVILPSQTGSYCIRYLALPWLLYSYRTGRYLGDLCSCLQPEAQHTHSRSYKFGMHNLIHSEMLLTWFVIRKMTKWLRNSTPKGLVLDYSTNRLVVTTIYSSGQNEFVLCELKVGTHLSPRDFGYDVQRRWQSNSWYDWSRCYSVIQQQSGLMTIPFPGEAVQDWLII